MPTQSDRLAVAATRFATVLLLAVLGWKLALLAARPQPLHAHRLLAAPPALRADSGRLVMVADAADGARSRTAEARIRRAHPRRPLTVHAVPWTSANARRTPAAGIAALVRAYGHAELPVLLTVSRDGQVVRVQSLAGGGE